MNSKLEQRKRSFSYNDLKKKRMQRQMKTKRKSPFKTIEPNQSSLKNRDAYHGKTISRPHSTIQVHSQAKGSDPRGSFYFSKNALRQKQDYKGSFAQIKGNVRQTIDTQMNEATISTERRTIEPAMQKLRYLNFPQKFQHSQNLDYLKQLKKKLNTNALEQRKSYNQGLNLNLFNKKFKGQEDQKLDYHKNNVQLKTKSSSKQLVKILLQRSKSKKRILRLQQIRDKIKSERSHSKSVQRSLEFTGIMALKDKLQENRSKKLNFKNQSNRQLIKPQSLSLNNNVNQDIQKSVPISKSKSKTRIRKFVPLNEEQQKEFLTRRIQKQTNLNIYQKTIQQVKQNMISRKQSKKKLCSPEKQLFEQWQQKQREVLKKYEVQLIPIQMSEQQKYTVKRQSIENQMVKQQKQTVRKSYINQQVKHKNQQKNEYTISSKEAKMELLMIDISQIQQKQQQNQDRNRPNQSFLGKSILEMVNTMNRKPGNRIPEQNTSNFLDLVGLETQDLKRVFSNREKKKMHEIQRLKRIFPQDFFKK